MSNQKQQNIKVCIGTLHYLRQKAQQDGLAFLDEILKNAAGQIEAGLRGANIDKSDVVDSELVSILQFTDLLSYCPEGALENFLKLAEEDEECLLNTKTAFH
jgi:hypothetical protein